MMAVTDQMNVRQKLGRKTFWIFLLGKSIGAIIFFCILIVFLVLASLGPTTFYSGISDQAGQTVEAFLILGLMGSALLFLVLLIIALVITWLEYRNYNFTLGDHALEVHRGILTKETISIPYHHIEDINIEQSIFYQMMGVCRVAILTAGHGDDEDKSEGILPTIDLKTGQEIQHFVMARSNTQEVINKTVS
ncbi:MAG TPA: PH domain-containing protein [Candidatus Paceibacterota bacterium]|nr:PH domain-containing protein [Candidatus Paceibacterota bacterium]